MAGNTPTLTNENYHIFEPSPIETSLASQVDDPAKPSAFPLLMSYRARNQISGDQYQSQIDQMHAIQQQQAAANQSAARADNFTKFLKVAGETPGAVAAMVSAGLVPQGADLSGVDAGSNVKAASLNMHNAGTGIGAAAQGGITGLTSAAQMAFGPQAGQTLSPAIVQAAALKAAGHGGGGKGGGNGMVSISQPVGPVGPNQGTARYKVPASMVPGLHYAPGAQGNEGDPGIPGTDAAPITAPTAAPVQSDKGAQIRKDIAASNVPPKPAPDGKGTLLTGASGQVYYKRN